MQNTIAYGGFFDIPIKEVQLQDLGAEIEARPDFWSNPEISGPLLKKKKALELAVQRAHQLTSTKEDVKVALELAPEGGEEYLQEASQLLDLLESELYALEIQSILGG